MRVFLFEYTCAMPLDAALPASLRGEGAAMLRAIWQDFSALPGVQVSTLLGEGWPGELGIEIAPTRTDDLQSKFLDCAAGCDYSLIIAPEFDGLLLTFARWVVEAGGRLLGPSPSAIELTSDKLALAEYWQQYGIPHPPTWSGNQRPLTSPPWVRKPRYGAGSQDMALVQESLLSNAATILQPFVPGMAASVAFLIGPAGRHALLPARQLLSEDGQFRYCGGELPLPSSLTVRALRLAERAVVCVPGLQGYVGVDLVLGEAIDGRDDYAIEINPRLTTSYLGLRSLAETNLAEAMLRVAAGDEAGIAWRKGRVRFGEPWETVSIIPSQ